MLESLVTNSRADNSTDGFFLKVARIVRVDYETMQVDVMFLDNSGGLPKIGLTSAYGGYRSFLGAMPTVGDWLLLGFGKSGNFRDPYIVQFIPRGYLQGIGNDVVRASKVVDSKLYPPLRFRMQKLYEGEIYALSKQGSEIHLDKNITIANSKLNEIFLKSSDQSISLTAINNYLYSCGVREASGLIHRNALIYDLGLSSDGVSQFPLWYAEDGTPYYTPNFSGPINAQYPYGNKTIDDFNSGFIEHRIEVKEMETPRLPVNESNSGVDVDTFYSVRPGMGSNKPLVVQIMGTLVGNDPVDDKKKYGVILKPKIFKSLSDQNARPTEEACIVENGINETMTLAAAYTLKFPNTATAFYVNKQGKIFQNIGASTGVDPMGAGESAEINLVGHAKISIGSNTSVMSLDLNTKGGVMTNFGYDQANLRSWDATFRNCVSWNIMGKDKNGLSHIMTTNGDVKTVIGGNRYTEIKGNDIRLVHGVLEDRVFGRKVDNYINDKHTNYGGSYIESVMGTVSQTIARGRNVTIAGPDITSGTTVADNTNILLGDSVLNMVLGSRKETIAAGMHSTSILAGNKTVSILAGSYKVTVGAGNIDISTAAGMVGIKTLTGMVTITGSLGVTIKSAVSVDVTAPKVTLGGLPIQGGVVNDGPMGHKCYITGGPHIGSKTVTCNSL